MSEAMRRECTCITSEDGVFYLCWTCASSAMRSSEGEE